VPLLIGAPTAPEYAERCIGALKDAFPGEQSEVRGFGGAEELAVVWEETLLNVHTATYEAYGMTIVEAAAFGVPTLLHEGTIGAKDLLPIGARFETDVSMVGSGARAASQELGRLLTPTVPGCSSAVGQKAREAALGWGLAAFTTTRHFTRS